MQAPNFDRTENRYGTVCFFGTVRLIYICVLYVIFVLVSVFLCDYVDVLMKCDGVSVLLAGDVVCVCMLW